MNTGIAGGLFLEGLLSFFTPCVLPVIPLYIGYLTADAKNVAEDGTVTYKRGKTFLLTLGFVLGISVVFVMMAAGSGFLNGFFQKHTLMFQTAGGVLLLLAGLMNLNVIQIPLLERTYRKQTDVKGGMTFVKAMLMGFFFSFAWSPCVGPMLAQALLTASSAATKTEGYIYIASYALGFICIFLLLGLFTGEVLNFLKKNRNTVKYTGLVSGLVVTGMGLYMFTQAYGTVRMYEAMAENSSTAAETETVPEEEGADIDNYGFALPDSEGNSIALTDYRGKTIVVNFFGTWCTYCNLELPGLQKIHETMDDVQILLVAAPHVNGEGDIEYIEKYMKDAGYTMPIVYDSSLEVTRRFGITGYPTTYIIRPDGSFMGYVPGYVEDEQMLKYLEEAGKTAE